MVGFRLRVHLRAGMKQAHRWTGRHTPLCFTNQIMLGGLTLTVSQVSMMQNSPTGVLSVCRRAPLLPKGLCRGVCWGGGGGGGGAGDGGGGGVVGAGVVAAGGCPSGIVAHSAALRGDGAGARMASAAGMGVCHAWDWAVHEGSGQDRLALTHRTGTAPSRPCGAGRAAPGCPAGPPRPRAALRRWRSALRLREAGCGRPAQAPPGSWTGCTRRTSRPGSPSGSLADGWPRYWMAASIRGRRRMGLAAAAW
jgi:hypothetical protein